jgi:hypothetical protein
MIGVKSGGRGLFSVRHIDSIRIVMRSIDRISCTHDERFRFECSDLNGERSH